MTAIQWGTLSGFPQLLVGSALVVSSAFLLRELFRNDHKARLADQEWMDRQYARRNRVKR